MRNKKIRDKVDELAKDFQELVRMLNWKGILLSKFLQKSDKHYTQYSYFVKCKSKVEKIELQVKQLKTEINILKKKLKELDNE